MSEKLLSRDFWVSLRSNTRVAGGNGKALCEGWCQDALQDGDVAQKFRQQTAHLGQIQIDQYATSELVHHWLVPKDGTPFVADGTAGQYDPSYPDGYYGDPDQASQSLKEVYSKKV